MAALTYNAASILHAIQAGRCYGFQIMDSTGLPSGTVYPALRRLEKTGLIRSQWERESIAHAEQRPARRYYRATKDGEEALSAAAQRYRLPELAAKGEGT